MNTDRTAAETTQAQSQNLPAPYLNQPRRPVIRISENSRELLRGLSIDMMKRAHDERKTFSEFLEELDPAHKYNDGFDAFSRLLFLSNLRLTGKPGRNIRASRYSEFMKTETGRILFVEALNREFNKSLFREGQRQWEERFKTQIYSTWDETAGSLPRPYSDDPMPRVHAEPSSAIPPRELVAIESESETNDYRTVNATPAAADLRFGRVASGVDLPLIKITTSDRAFELHKYGGAIEYDYESLGDYRFDKIALVTVNAFRQLDVDLVNAAIDVLVNGDGQSGAATSINLTTLISGATVNTLPLSAYIAIQLELQNNYVVDTILTNKAIARLLFLLSSGAANIILWQFINNSQIGGFDSFDDRVRQRKRLGITEDVGTGLCVFFDSTRALESVYRVAGEFAEQQMFVRNQTAVLTFTYRHRYLTFTDDAVVILNIAA